MITEKSASRQIILEASDHEGRRMAWFVAVANQKGDIVFFGLFTFFYDEHNSAGNQYDRQQLAGNILGVLPRSHFGS